jgi:CheY-like chemotaxis protein
MSFPLFKRPGGVVFLDDDPDYLEMLAEVMPADWYVRLHISPIECIAAVQSEPAIWEADAWRHQEIINRWQAGSNLVAEILKYWQADGHQRYALTRVLVVDYAMPAMSGLQVLGELKDWRGARVLLTGRVEEQLAVSAFNRGLIEKFVPKQSPEIRLRLTEAIVSLLEQPDARHEQTWRATLAREQHGWLCEPSIAAALQTVASREGWIEHVVLGAPFGVLARDRRGRTSWLQLESPGDLPELADMAGSEGWDTATQDAIRAGRQLVALELKLALGSSYLPRAQNAFTLGGRDAVLHAAIFSLDDTAPVAGGAPGDNSYDAFLLANGHRMIAP